MSKDNRYPIFNRSTMAPLILPFYCGSAILAGCASMVTEVEAKLCVAEEGKPLPSECFPKGGQYGGEVVPEQR